MRYQKSETGWLLIGFFFPFVLFLGLIHILKWGDQSIPNALIVILEAALIFIILLFYKLTVEVHDDHVLLKYGIGLIRIKLRIDSIGKTEVIQTPWYWGLGIRITQDGMLYNIHSSKALKIKYQSNGMTKTVLIGSKEPTELENSLREAFSSPT